MRPRLLGDVRYIECPEGVYIHGGLGSCLLAGRSVHRWIEVLAPRLQGRHSLDEITRGLPEEHREMVESLVATLVEQRFVVDARDERAHTLSAAESQEYAPEIAFIRYGYDSAEWRFQRVREARVLLYGRGPVLAALVEEGLRSGWRRLHVLARADADAVRAAAGRGRRDGDQEVTVETASSQGGRPAAERLRERVAEADLVVQVAVGGEVEGLAEVGRACADAGVALAQVLVRGTDAWCTPVHGREHLLAESGWRWLAAAGRPGADEDGADEDGADEDGADEDRADEDGTDWLTGPVPELIAAQVALAAFRHLAGMRPERHGMPAGAPVRGTMTRVDLRSLHTTVHRFHRHPAPLPGAVAGCDATRDVIASLAGAERIAPAEFLGRARRFEDPHLGVIRSLDEGDLPQLPFALCRAVVAAPYAGFSAASGLGWGAERETARVRALLESLAVHRFLVARHDLEVRGGQGGPWGMDLLSGAMRRVPREAVIPAAPAAPVPVGVAAGLCWHDAVEAALLAHCEALPAVGADAVRAGAVRAGAVRAGEMRADAMWEAGDDVIRLLDRIGLAAEFREHGAAGLPAFTVTVAGEGMGDADVVVRSVAPTRERALRHAAEQAVVRWQARGAVPRVRRWTDGAPETPRRPEDLTDLAGALARATGRAPVVVPLAREADPLLPFAVQVVLCGD